MTRYNNPLPHAQASPSQGRPAASGQHPHQQPHHQPGFGEPELTGWPQAPQPQPHRQAAPQHRPAAAGSYPDLGYPTHDAPQHDPYAALRPDGYGGAPQPAASGDPYGLAGYSAPQGTGPGYAPRTAPQPQAAPAFGSFGAQGDPYAAPGQPGGYQQPGYGGAHGHAAGHGLEGHGLHGQDARGHAPLGNGAGNGYPASSADYADYAMPPQAADAFGALRAGAAPTHAADQWGAHDHEAHGFSLDPHAHDYAGQEAYAGQDAYAEPQAHDQWGADAYGAPLHGDPALQHQHDAYQGQHGGALDQSYADDDAMYEEDTGRSGWKKVAVLMACTVVVGGGLTYAFSGLIGPGSGEPPPVVKGATGPSKVKPSEPGGKRFDHADSKIMGRLGEGSSSGDASGVRKVPVVSVGRDGSIKPPPTGQGETQAIVSVPGLTVIDNFGGAPGSGGRPPSAAASPAAGPSPDRPVAPKVKMVTGADTSGGSGAATKKAAAAAKAPAAPKADTPKKIAAASASTSSSSAASTGPRPTGAGYVAVLASVPASASSRIDALTQFADMQQRYGNILSNKTPDIQEANLGEKGTYHRLLVGPPGSRDSANTVCNQLKQQGYSGCWITAY